VTVTKRRDRLVYFRISEEEFERMQKACDATGARSVSDLARAAVQEFISPQKNESEAQVFEIVKSLRAVVDEINQSVRQLMLNCNSGSQAVTQTAAAAAAASEPVREMTDSSVDPK
jgi:hypothetical protein